jgi:hypothetical protein
MNGIMTKWVALREYDIDGPVSDETVAEWLAAVRLSYLDLCPVLRARAVESGADLVFDTRATPTAAGLGNATGAIVSATAAEFHPDSFTLSLRVRPIGGDQERPLDARCVVRLVDPATGAALELGKAIRDELIALEHAAREYN